jgi:hypothetical protein
LSTKSDVAPGKDAAKKIETKAPVKVTKKKKEPMIYLGPDIKGIARYCDVFSEKAGSFFDEKAKEVPILRDLLFPINEGGKKLAELKNGGPAYRLYQAAKEQLMKGDKRKNEQSI